MTHTTPFHPLDIPIDGTNLIEASAGTGKTWGIAALFTRLIVLEQLPVENVLVVTFTKAATAELKTRLRARLNEALQALQEQETSDGLYNDAFIADLLGRALVQESRERLILRLKAAIGSFDNAAIYTIHGFCQRLLRDYAFLCQVPFDTELAEADRDRLLTPAQDFWRTRVITDAQTAQLVFKYKLTPATTLAEIQSFLNRPYLTFRRPETDLAQAVQAVQVRWQQIVPKLADLEANFWRVFAGLKKNIYKQPTFQEVFAELHTAAAQKRLPQDSKQKWPLLAADELAKNLGKGQSPDLAAFASLQVLADLSTDMAALEQAEADTLIALKLDMLAYINQAQAEQKKNRRERGYDDLLLDVHHALTTALQGTALAQAVAKNWHVALIDEFQDTDPLQYEIFSRIFIRHGNPLFLVGDPKQAIYSFRGADIYAYLQAAEDADHRYTLTTNHRSHAKLINGISALFQLKKQPFVLTQIGYTDVSAAREHSRLSPPRDAIQVRWIDDGNEASNKETLRRRAAEYCADEIADVLNQAAQGRLNFDGMPLQSGHIAVLVRTHNEGSLIAAALKARQVQSVLLHRESVFATPEAISIAALIGFWLHPQRTEPLRFVLGSVLFQQSAAELYALNHDEAALLDWINSAETAATQWRQHGFYAAMQQFAARHGIETRLLAAANERSLTNYHQILEKLAEEDEQNHSPSSLHQWLLAQIQADRPNDNHLLRLESDEALVKIVTMHAAKGLQYPLVFCPFVWDAPDNKPDSWQILHRHSGASELLAQTQLNEADREQLADEAAGERLRLLYVALTRAEEQLTLYAAHCNHTAANSFAYLLEGSADSCRSDTEAAYTAKRKTAKAAGEKAMLRCNWLRFIQHAPVDTSFTFSEESPISAANQNYRRSDGHYQATAIPTRSFIFIHHTSFTGLSRHTKTQDNERDELKPVIDPAEAATFERPSEESQNTATDNIHYFPRGAHAGICLHELLENLDFNTPAAEQQNAVADTLVHYGFNTQWLPAVTTMLDHTRLSPLTGRYTLADQPANRRLPEMAFTLHMRDFKLDALRCWFSQPHLNLPAICRNAAQRLNFQDVQGYLNGFIDMVYQDADGQVCIIDYKSNHLGMSSSDYSPEAMNEAMAEHHYYLQALIYAIAIARYFTLRGQTLPKIAVRYLFLRGLDGSGNGVWKWDIDIADLTEWLA